MESGKPCGPFFCINKRDLWSPGPALCVGTNEASAPLSSAPSLLPSSLWERAERWPLWPAPITAPVSALVGPKCAPQGVQRAPCCEPQHRCSLVLGDEAEPGPCTAPRANPAGTRLCPRSQGTPGAWGHPGAIPDPWQSTPWPPPHSRHPSSVWTSCFCHRPCPGLVSAPHPGERARAAEQEPLPHGEPGGSAWAQLQGGPRSSSS